MELGKGYEGFWKGMSFGEFVDERWSRVWVGMDSFEWRNYCGFSFCVSGCCGDWNWEVRD